MRALRMERSSNDLEREYARDLPDAELLAIGQLHDQQALLAEDKSCYPRFVRLEGVHSMTGSLAPAEVWFVGAKVGSGKSLFCQNFMDDLIGQGIVTLYIGTEQDAHVLKLKHACIRAGVPARLMIKPERHEVESVLYREAESRVNVEMEWLASKQMSRTALFANSEYIDRHELNVWIRGGVRKYGLKCVIVDHIDQVKHGEGMNPVAEITATVQLLHEMAREYQIPIVIASQLKRSYGDAFKRYSPPDEEDFAGASGKERIASVMLGLWRPLRTDLSMDELKVLKERAKQGSSAEDRLFQENTMGVRLLKDRLGSSPGMQTMVHVGKGGLLSDDPASTHGIRTSR
jgi:hypothetical protein